MSYSDIRANLEEICQVEISAGAISQITDRLLPELQEWRQRPLASRYAVLYLDAVHFKVREDGRVVPKAVYSLLGIDRTGRKDILGLYLSDSEGASHWAAVLSDLRERGVDDVLIACADGPKGFPEAVAALFPKTEVQLCAIHQIRHSLRYVSSKDQKAFVADLKRICRAPSKATAEENLLRLEESWGKKYPVAVRSRVNNWDGLSTYFKYDSLVRTIVYTTNAVEGMHRMIRKYAKSKGAFTSENALLRLVFCAYKKLLSKWTQPVQNWAQIVSRLDIHFPGRLGLDESR